MGSGEIKAKQSDASEGMPRYALYWAPPAQSEFAERGAAWLGRDAEWGKQIPRPALAGFDPDYLDAVTAAPRRYGLHATLKPPFQLASGRSLAELEAEIHRFAVAQTPVKASILQIAQVDRFLALIPATPSAAINALAQDCVEHFDRFRFPPSDAELKRRRSARLTPAQEVNLQRWGYPYVKDDFRFHITLTGRLEPSAAERLIPALKAYFAPVMSEPFEAHEIALFVESTPGASFRLLRRFRLG